MTEEERIAALEAERDEAVARAEKLAEQDANKVEEIKQLRTRAQEAEARYQEAINAQINNKPSEDKPKESFSVEAAVQAELDRREAQRRKQDFEMAVNEFKASKPEFQADESGLVFEKFKQSLSRFNFSDIGSKEEAKKALEDVYRFTNFKYNQEEAPAYEGSPRGGVTPPNESGKPDQNAAALSTQTGLQPERVRALQEKYGDAFASLANK